MPKALVTLDRQHAGKFSHPRDLGAAYDLDDDGKVEVWEQEAMLTPLYGLGIEERIRDVRSDIDVIWLSDGDYAERHKRANEYAKAYDFSVYLPLHLNAGGGGYAASIYDAASGKSNGPALAGHIAQTLKDACPELADSHVRAASPTNKWKRAHATFAGVGLPVSVCLEPFFLDNKNVAHSLATPAGLRRVGGAIADGVIRWLEVRL